MRITDLAPVAIIFVVAGIVIGIGSEIIENIETSVTDQDASAICNNTTLGLSKLAQWMPTIGLVVAAAIVIGVVFSSFVKGSA